MKILGLKWGGGKYFRALFFLTLVVSIVSCSATDQSQDFSSYSLASPDGRISLSLDWGETDSPKYSVSFDGQPIILSSEIDLIAAGVDAKHRLVFQSESQVDEATPLTWGQFDKLYSHYHQAEFLLQDDVTGQSISLVEFRIFNDAVAFRHVFQQGAQTRYAENSQFNLVNDYGLWSNQGEKDPKFIPSLLGNEGEELRLPIVLLKDGEPSVVIQEAALIESGQMAVRMNAGSLSLNVESDLETSNKIPEATAWRVIQVADQLGDLLTSQVLVSLSPESKVEDTSWIKTGKSFWDWRVRGAVYGDHTYALDNESLERMIDFAAEHGMQHVMIDANWYGPEHQIESDPYTEIEGLHIRSLIEQANQRGVGFILYLNDRASVNHDLDDLFKAWSSWGAAGVKYGFMEAKGQEKVEKTLHIVELAAKHELLINFHDGPIAPSGLRRTWPNWVTREYVHAQTDGAKSFSPSGFVKMAHVHALTGPLDMSNGFFQLEGLVESRRYVREEVYSTVASEVARSLVIFSGLIIFPDSPEEYLRKIDLFEFLQEMPGVWDESKVIDSNINSHIVTARRSGDQWFVGAVVDEEGVTINLGLDFLDDNQRYEAKIFSDTDETHFQTNRESYEIIVKDVSKDDLLEMVLAPGGGQAIWFKPINQ